MRGDAPVFTFRFLVSFLLAIGVAVAAPTASARVGVITPLRSSEASAGDRFGLRLALDGDTLLVSDERDRGATGHVFVLVQTGSTWSEQVVLASPNPSSGEKFGNAVAIQGNTLLIGARFRNTPARLAGQVDVFERTGSVWSQSQTLSASDAVEFMTFGSAIALEGDTMVIGSSHSNSALPDQAYVFERTEGVWSEVAILPAPVEVHTAFGASVDISGNTIAIGARIGGPSSGGVVALYTGGGASWSLQQALTHPNPLDFDDDFGFALDLEGDTLAVGADGADEDASGSAYVFLRNAGIWTLEARLKADRPRKFGQFGHSVRLLGDELIVGAPGYYKLPGLAHRFEKGAGIWSFAESFEAPNPRDGDAFGAVVAYDGEIAIIASPISDASRLREEEPGTVFLFSECSEGSCLQRRDQQRCINQLNKSFLKVAKAQGKENTKCIKNASKGKLTTKIEVCLRADIRGRVNKARGKTTTKVAAACAGLVPDFAFTDADTANAVGVQTELDLIHEIFGSDLDDVVVDAEADKATARCQREVAKNAHKCHRTQLKEFVTCKKNGLKGKTAKVPGGAAVPFAVPEDVQECMGFDLKGKIQRVCETKLNDKIAKKCLGVGLEVATPGRGTADPGQLATCVRTKVGCAVCNAINLVDDLERDCEFFDDGLANGSCNLP